MKTNLKVIINILLKSKNKVSREEIKRKSLGRD